LEKRSPIGSAIVNRATGADGADLVVSLHAA
jgi:hypothetical protein